MADASYEDFVRPYRQTPQDSDPDPAELRITSIEGDEKPVYDDAAKFEGECYEASFWGVRVSAAGNLGGFFSDSSHAGFGGGGAPMPKDDFEKLQRLLDELPSDGGRLPPPGHKLVVQLFRSGVATVRVYDRANLPDAVLTILRLTKARVQILNPTFTPAKVWTQEEAQSLGLPHSGGKTRWGGTVSPDGSIRVTSDFVCHCLTVYPAESDEELHVIHEFWQDDWAEGEGYMSPSTFSPDGRRLLVQWGKGAVLYDTDTWNVVKDAKQFPQGLVAYHPSEDWKLGLAVTAKGECLVWDAESRRVLSKLDGPVSLHSIAFSQDGTELAIYSIGEDSIVCGSMPEGVSTEGRRQHLTVWDVRTGHMTHDLWAAVWASYANGPPVWWNRGKWLAAPYWSEGGIGGTGLWDATTGRFLGTLDLSQCRTNVQPVDRQSLLQQCFAGQTREGPVLEWTVAGVQGQIDAAIPK